MPADLSDRARSAETARRSRVGDALLRDRLIGNRPAEGDAARRAAAHRFERSLGKPDESHAVMDAAGAKATLRDLKAASRAEQHVGRGHAHVIEIELGVAMR